MDVLSLSFTWYGWQILTIFLIRLKRELTDGCNIPGYRELLFCHSDDKWCIWQQEKRGLVCKMIPIKKLKAKQGTSGNRCTWIANKGPFRPECVRSFIPCLEEALHSPCCWWTISVPEIWSLAEASTKEAQQGLSSSHCMMVTFVIVFISISKTRNHPWR